MLLKGHTWLAEMKHTFGAKLNYEHSKKKQSAQVVHIQTDAQRIVTLHASPSSGDNNLVTCIRQGYLYYKYTIVQSYTGKQNITSLLPSLLLRALTKYGLVFCLFCSSNSSLQTLKP